MTIDELIQGLSDIHADVWIRCTEELEVQLQGNPSLLDDTQRNTAKKILLKYFHTSGDERIKLAALTTLVTLAKSDQFLKPTVRHLLEIAAKSEFPLLSDRAKQLSV